KRWESALSALLPRGQFCKFDLRQLLRPDSVQRAAVIVALRNAGVLSANEARDLYEDLGPIPNIPNPGKGDIWLQPLNVGEAGTPPVVSEPGGSKAAGDYGYESRQAALDFLHFCGVSSRHELLGLLHGDI
ncbi:MAG TPA: hypothetical protein VMU14_07915, partial [Acidimicrobiales bacterium]|nr:hypothetical protein [Acidimicrobiales bacterium]